MTDVSSRLQPSAPLHAYALMIKQDQIQYKRAAATCKLHSSIKDIPSDREFIVMSKTERQMESNMATSTSTTDGRHPQLDYTVASSPFAGRVGGNQDFVVTSQDDDASEVLKKLPDAVRLV